MTVLDRAQATPLYHQVFLMLRDDILSGALLDGDAVPTERELADRHAISRITARRALDELAQAGFVARKRRIGTRVTFRQPARPLEAGIGHAVESLLAFGRETQVSVLELADESAAPALARMLEIADGDAVTRAVRLRSLDGEPLGRVTSWLPSARAPQVALGGLATTPMLALLREGGLAIGAARQTIGAGVADPGLAALLAVEPRAAILWIERLVRDDAGLPALFTRAEYRADRYRITLDLNSDSDAPMTFGAG